MTTEEHKARHIKFHKMLDELLADFLVWNPGKLPSSTTVLEFLKWSNLQTKAPREGEPPRVSAIAEYRKDQITKVAKVAAAIANTRAGRRGDPPIENVLEIVPENIRKELFEDAEAAIVTLEQSFAM